MRRFLFSVFLTCLICATAIADSPTFHSDPQRTGRGDSSGPVEPDTLWSFETGGSTPASPVIAADGTVYVVSADGRLYALDENGVKKWEFKAEESLFATPSLDAAGVVYFGDLAGWFYAVGPDGALRWKTLLPDGRERRILGSAAVTPAGRSFVASWNNRLYALNVDGSILWQAPLGGLATSSPVVDAAGNVYITCLDPSSLNLLATYKFAPDSSQPVWVSRTDLGIGRNRITSSPAIDLSRQRLYVGACAESTGVLVAVDIVSGQIAFRRTLPKGVVSSPAIGADGTIFVSCLDGRLYALRPQDAAQRWVFQTEALYILGSPSLDNIGNIYVGASDGVVYALSSAGQELWRFTTGSNVESAPVAHDRRLHVTSFDGRLYVLAAADARTSYFPQVASGALGISSLETALRFTNTGPDTSLQVEFFDSNASPMMLSWESAAPSSAVTVPLGKGQSVKWRTLRPGTTNDLKVGYARFTAGAGVGAAAILRYAEGSTIMYETGVPSTAASRDLSLFVDSANHRSTGLALVNDSNKNAEVRFRLYGQAFNLVDDRTLQQALGYPSLGIGAHVARFASELFPRLQTDPLDLGLMTIESDQPLAAATLCLGGDPAKSFPETVPTLSVFPVIAARPENPPGQAGQSVFYFPQVADGEAGSARVRTTLYFTNVGDDAVARVEFLTNNQPAALDLVGRGPTSLLEFAIKKGEVIRFETAGGPELATAYARVTTGSTVTGNAVYSYTQSGVTLFEATVPASRSLERFTIFVEEAPDPVATALGIVNVGSQAAAVTLHVYDKDAHLLVERALEPLPAGSAVRQHLSELLLDSSGWQTQGVILTVTSDQPLAALALCEAGDLWSFPAQVYRLSSMPVLEGNIEP